MFAEVVDPKTKCQKRGVLFCWPSRAKQACQCQPSGEQEDRTYRDFDFLPSSEIISADRFQQSPGVVRRPNRQKAYANQRPIRQEQLRGATGPISAFRNCESRQGKPKDGSLFRSCRLHEIVPNC